MNNTFSRQKNRLINKIKYHANRLLFPISFIDTFALKKLPYDNINVYDAPKIYNYLNTYNNFIMEIRNHLIKLNSLTKWGLLNDSHILLKMKSNYLTKMINIYTNLILKFINNSKKNKIYDSSQFNYLSKNKLLLFMKIYKLNNKYILNDGNFISSVSEAFIDTLFTSNIYNELHSKINYPLNHCDCFNGIKNDNEMSFIF